MKKSLDLEALRQVWEDWIRPAMRDRFATIERRAVTDAEVDRWAPFEAVVALAPSTGAELMAFVDGRVASRMWAAWQSPWEPWDEEWEAAA